MTEPTSPDPLRSWADAMDQLLRGIGAGADAKGLPAQLLEPLQQQRDFIATLGRQQTEWQGQLVDRIVAPLEAMESMIGEAATTMREQAQALGQAASALATVSTTLNTQAELFERGERALKDRAETARSLAGLAGHATESTTRPRGDAPAV
jgi:methyl-accepting chemotaxis protein